MARISGPNKLTIATATIGQASEASAVIKSANSFAVDAFRSSRKTITTITLRGHDEDEVVCRVSTRGDRHKAQHARLVRFAEYAEARENGFDVDPLVLHNIAIGRGAF